MGRRYTRRGFIATGLALIGAGGAGCLSSPVEPEGRVGAETVATGLTAPLDLADAGDGLLYVAEQTGAVRVVTDAGLRNDSLLDLSPALVGLDPGYDERGLLGIALHPGFPEDRRLFVRYSAPPRPSTPAGYDHTFVLSELRVDPDGLGADPATERTLLEIPEPQSNHNAGGLAFGPDGYLYVGVGDGGGSGDAGRGHVPDWYPDTPGGNGQDVAENLLGSVLRIDVDGRDDGKAYGVPEDNPLVGRRGLDEQYAWGFRNPWRMSFDGEHLYVADVGQDRYEEVNRVESGGNYGWNVREGPSCYAEPECPDVAPDGGPLRAPVISYPHGGPGPRGIAVAGGHIYRGDDLPGLRGRFVFGDWQSNGLLFSAEPRGRVPWRVTALEIVPTDGRDPGRYLLALGRDADGELYVLTSRRAGPSGDSGSVHRLTPL